MSIPEWIREICDKTPGIIGSIRFRDPLTAVQLKEVYTFLESNQTTIRIDTITLYPTTPKEVMETAFKGLHQNSKIHTVKILVEEDDLVDPAWSEWIVGLNQAPASTAVKFKLAEVRSLESWIRPLQLNTTVTSLSFQNCQFTPSDVKELIGILSSNFTITTLDFNLSSDPAVNPDFGPLCTLLKSDCFITSLSIEYDVDQPVDDLAIVLSDVLTANSTLTSVVLIGKKMTLKGWSAFADALNYNSTLVTLNLPSKRQDCDVRKLIRSRLARNRSRVLNHQEILRQIAVIQEGETRRLIKQTKLDADKGIQSPVLQVKRRVHQLTDAEIGEKEA